MYCQPGIKFSIFYYHQYISDSEEIHQSNSDKQNNFLHNNERKTLMKK